MNNALYSYLPSRLCVLHNNILSTITRQISIAIALGQRLHNTGHVFKLLHHCVSQKNIYFIFLGERRKLVASEANNDAHAKGTNVSCTWSRVESVMARQIIYTSYTHTSSIWTIILNYASYSNAEPDQANLFHYRTENSANDRLVRTTKDFLP